MVAAETLRQLMATVPRDFVATRNALAKQLKATGDGERAASVGALRRPSVTDWALNVASATAPDDTAAFVDVARGVLDAQEEAMAGRAATELRRQLEELREKTATLVAAGRVAIADHGLTGAGSSAADLTTRLGAVAGNRAALDLLATGLLGTEDVGVVDPFGSGEAPAARSAARAAPAKPSPAPAEPSPAVDLAARREERAAATAAARAVADAEEELATAERVVTKRSALAAKAHRRQAAAEEALVAATAAATAADTDLATAEERRERAAAALAETQRQR